MILARLASYDVGHSFETCSAARSNESMHYCTLMIGVEAEQYAKDLPGLQRLSVSPKCKNGIA